MDRHPSAARRALLGAALAALLAGAACGGGREPGSTARANVLLVTLDTTRADRLSCYGNPAGTSPSLDRLASEGARFDLAIAQAAVTPVSHASILTGLDPHRHGLRVLHAERGYRLPETVPTLATILREGGWRTAAFLSSFTVSEHFGFERGFEVFDNGLDRSAEGLMTLSPDGAWRWDVRSNQRRADATTDRAIGWLERTEEPFFLWVHYWDPHDDALVPPTEIVARFVPVGGTAEEALIGLYDAEIFYMDAQIGRLFEALRASGRYDRTIVAVVADHGEGLGDHGWWHHRILYQEQIRVPMILRMPGGGPGRVVGEVVRTTDIVPTVLEALDISPPVRLDGASLKGLMEGEGAEPRIAYADALNRYDLNARMLDRRPQDGLLFCALEYPYKLIYRPDSPADSELYDLSGDPGETVNIYTRERGPAERLEAFLKASGGFVEGPFGEGEGDPEALERLRSLGYVGGPGP